MTTETKRSLAKLPKGHEITREKMEFTYFGKRCEVYRLKTKNGLSTRFALLLQKTGVAEWNRALIDMDAVSEWSNSKMIRIESNHQLVLELTVAAAMAVEKDMLTTMEKANDYFDLVNGGF